ncbi:MAG: 1-acyl-sn-glycerol-3-phosphate acyltransferase [Sandaracinaceae bacterium]|nr:1-acyl-sn-glycerol-3-phosphate acyltransferase [Sandaracinaceae bacterium]
MTERSELVLARPEEHGFSGTLRRVARMALISSWTSWVVMGARIRGLPPEGTHAAGLRHWAHGARRILGVDFEVVHGEARAPERARLVVANHRTPLDIIPLVLLFGGHFLANHKTRKAPVIGGAAELVGTIFVDRDDRRSGANAIRQMKRYLEEKRTVIVFPEGTTHAGDEVRPFQRGAFLAAKGLDAEIVPVGIAYPPGAEFVEQSLGQHARGFLSRPANRAWVSIGDPLPADSVIKDEEQVRAKVQELVHRSREGSREGSRGGSREGDEGGAGR